MEEAAPSIKEALGLAKDKEPKRNWYQLALFGLVFGCIFPSFFIIGLYFSTQRRILVSPLADSSTDPVVRKASPNDQKTTTDNYPPSSYFPKSLAPTFSKPLEEVTAIAYAAMDSDSHELLLAKNLTLRRPIASITKIMTALVAMEHANIDNEYLVTAAAITAGEASMGLTVGERVTLAELLYGLLLPSGNDAAETLAEGVFLGSGSLVAIGGGTVLGVATDSASIVRNHSRATFIARMNEKGRSLGMFDTRFVNPTGLDEDKVENSSYSSVLDLLALGSFALDNERLRSIVGTKTMFLPFKANYHKAFVLSNILGLRQSYPGVAGIKPGNTDFAKETLLSYAENGGKKIILVLLGSDRTRDDAVKIYDFLFENLGVKVKKRSLDMNHD